MNAAYLKSKFEAGLGWEAYLATDGQKAANWQTCYDQARLSKEQQQLVEGFVRRIKVLCVSGIWCGDCVQQGPLINVLAEQRRQQTTTISGHESQRGPDE